MAKELCQQRKRTFWTDEEDAELAQLVAIHGIHSWPEVAAELNIGRDSKACSLRWRYFLAPHIIRSTDHKLCHWEVAVLFWGLKHFGTKWRTIVDNYLPWRSPNDLKNYANQYIKTKSQQVVSSNTYLAQGYSIQDLVANQPAEVAQRWQRVKEMQDATPANQQPQKKGTRGLTYIIRSAGTGKFPTQAQQTQHQRKQPYSRPGATRSGAAAAAAAGRGQPSTLMLPGTSLGSSNSNIMAASAAKAAVLAAGTGGVFGGLNAPAAAAGVGGSGEFSMSWSTGAGGNSSGNVTPAAQQTFLRPFNTAVVTPAGAPAQLRAGTGGTTFITIWRQPPGTTPLQQQQQQKLQPVHVPSFASSQSLPYGLPLSAVVMPQRSTSQWQQGAPVNLTTQTATGADCTMGPVSYLHASTTPSYDSPPSTGRGYSSSSSSGSHLQSGGPLSSTTSSIYSAAMAVAAHCNSGSLGQQQQQPPFAPHQQLLGVPPDASRPAYAPARNVNGSGGVLPPAAAVFKGGSGGSFTSSGSSYASASSDGSPRTNLSAGSGGSPPAAAGAGHTPGHLTLRVPDAGSFSGWGSFGLASTGSNPCGGAAAGSSGSPYQLQHLQQQQPQVPGQMGPPPPLWQQQLQQQPQQQGQYYAPYQHEQKFEPHHHHQPPPPPQQQQQQQCGVNAAPIAMAFDGQVEWTPEMLQLLKQMQQQQHLHQSQLPQQQQQSEEPASVPFALQLRGLDEHTPEPQQQQHMPTVWQPYGAGAPAVPPIPEPSSMPPAAPPTAPAPAATAACNGTAAGVKRTGVKRRSIDIGDEELDSILNVRTSSGGEEDSEERAFLEAAAADAAAAAFMQHQDSTSPHSTAAMAAAAGAAAAFAEASPGVAAATGAVGAAAGASWDLGGDDGGQATLCLDLDSDIDLDHVDLDNDDFDFSCDDMHNSSRARWEIEQELMMLQGDVCDGQQQLSEPQMHTQPEPELQSLQGQLQQPLVRGTPVVRQVLQLHARGEAVAHSPAAVAAATAVTCR